jgi:hypothetical protein
VQIIYERIKIETIELASEAMPNGALLEGCNKDTGEVFVLSTLSNIPA